MTENLKKFCVMTNRNGILYYDKVIFAETWGFAELLCDDNEFVHGEFVTEIEY